MFYSRKQLKGSLYRGAFTAQLQIGIVIYSFSFGDRVPAWTQTPTYITQASLEVLILLPQLGI